MLRAIELDDAEWLYDCYQDPLIKLRMPPDTSVDSEFDAWEMIRVGRARARNGEGITIVICRIENRERIGVLDVDMLDDAADGTAAELGMFLTTKARGQHLALPTLLLVCKWALDHAPIDRLWAEVRPDNPAMLKTVHQTEFVEIAAGAWPPGFADRPDDSQVFARTCNSPS